MSKAALNVTRLPDWVFNLLPRKVRQELYWREIFRCEREDARVDATVYAFCQTLKRALPDAYIYKIRDNSYMGEWGYAYFFIDRDGILIREWGGYHKPDTPIEKLVQIIREQDDYWVERYGHKCWDVRETHNVDREFDEVVA